MMTNYILLSTSTILILGIIQPVNARSLSEDLELLATKDQKLNVINEADNNSEIFNQIGDTCEKKIQFYDTLESCITLFEKFDYYMDQLWNDSKKQIDEIGVK